MLNGIAITVFALSSAALAVYGLHLYVLLWLAHRRAGEQRRTQRETIDRFWTATCDDSCPVVTSQIPLYNEREVARRVIEAVAAMDYPAGRHEIQVLDDSTDNTRGIVERVAESLRKGGHDVQVIRRPHREGFKAGALAYGLEKCRGQFVAVFDADFVPPRDFLRQAVPLLCADEGAACVQGRWEHLNPEESWLTQAQALGIDGHFAVEQAARSWNGLLMNFNGTAGVWRKAAILDPAVGGWNGDTLTEDLDLSYRAQLAGWRIAYNRDMVCPGEIPADIQAFKSQQRRWATGSIQVARKLLPSVWKSSLSLVQKIEATLHLTYYTVSVWMLLMLLASQPMIGVWLQHPVRSGWIGLAWIGVALSSAAPPVLYIYSNRVLRGNWRGLWRVPLMMLLGMGACVDTAVATLRGMFVDGGEFVRTPKSGSTSQRRKRSSYQSRLSRLWLAELGMGGYALIGAVCYGAALQWPSCGFLLLYAIGLLIVGWTSRPPESRSIFPTPPSPESLGDLSPA